MTRRTLYKLKQDIPEAFGFSKEVAREFSLKLAETKARSIAARTGHPVKILRKKPGRLWEYLKTINPPKK